MADKIQVKRRRQPTSTVETQITPVQREWWPYSRREQFDELRALLSEITSINNGSSALERIARCIALAAKLNGTRREDDMRTPSFVRFLEDEMFKGDKPKAEQP